MSGVARSGPGTAGGDGARPTVLLIYPASWLARRRGEWAPLAAAAAAAGFRAVVAGWDALAVGDGAVRARECLVQTRPAGDPVAGGEIAFSPDVVLTTWGVDWDHQGLFDAIVAVSGCRHSESTLLAWLDGKRELELCLRGYEARTGASIPRPRTLLSEEISADHPGPGDDLVIVKPSRGGQCRGIEIVPRGAVAAMVGEAAAGARPPFVVQPLVEDVFLYDGRRWDMRVHAMATSLSPLEYRLYPEGVAKTAGALARPGSARPEEWLNAESYLEGVQTAENLALTQMLGHLARTHAPLAGFWRRLDELVRDVFLSIALFAERWPHPLGRAFLFAGLDLIVERRGTRDYELRLLELNSHPGLGWEPGITSRLAPHYAAWFADLLALADPGAGAPRRGREPSRAVPPA